MEDYILENSESLKNLQVIVNNQMLFLLLLCCCS